MEDIMMRQIDISLNMVLINGTTFVTSGLLQNCEKEFDLKRTQIRNWGHLPGLAFSTVMYMYTWYTLFCLLLICLLLTPSKCYTTILIQHTFLNNTYDGRLNACL